MHPCHRSLERENCGSDRWSTRNEPWLQRVSRSRQQKRDGDHRSEQSDHSRGESKISEISRVHGATVVASLPCYTADNTDKQRGTGVFDRSIEALQRLNELGYGKAGTGLELDLVYNPGGPALPPDQQELEAEYKKRLAEEHGIVFNALYTITNLPISRFLEFLVSAGRFEEYMNTLVNAYNPVAAEGVMCRNTL